MRGKVLECMIYIFGSKSYKLKLLGKLAVQQISYASSRLNLFLELYDSYKLMANLKLEI